MISGLSYLFIMWEGEAAGGAGWGRGGCDWSTCLLCIVFAVLVVLFLFSSILASV